MYMDPYRTLTFLRFSVNFFKYLFCSNYSLSTFGVYTFSYLNLSDMLKDKNMFIFN